jgi:hypothetical protein
MFLFLQVLFLALLWSYFIMFCCHSLCIILRLTYVTRSFTLLLYNNLLSHQHIALSMVQTTDTVHAFPILRRQFTSARWTAKVNFTVSWPVIWELSRWEKSSRSSYHFCLKWRQTRFRKFYLKIRQGGTFSGTPNSKTKLSNTKYQYTKDNLFKKRTVKSFVQYTC